jgi:hypothetical protein
VTWPSATVRTVEIPRKPVHQAVCENCGWRSPRLVDAEAVQGMVDLHLDAHDEVSS